MRIYSVYSRISHPLCEAQAAVSPPEMEQYEQERSQTIQYSFAHMDTDLLPDVVVADSDPGQLSDRSAGSALEPRRDAG